MPTFSSEQLHQIAVLVLEGADVPSEGAAMVARELVEANLVGHDSHGVHRLLEYVDQIRRGFLKPRGTTRLVVDQPSIAVMDGAWQFGQVVATQALELAAQRARETGAFTVLCHNCWHVGRLGSYTRSAALDGFMAWMAVHGAARGRVVPWGGVERRLGTNPISIAAPWGDDAFVLDMTSSVVAAGKIEVANHAGERIPEGWISDARGNTLTDPAAFVQDPTVSLMPLGGSVGFKGYGLAVMIDILCGVLAGSGFARTDIPPGANGVWLHLIDCRKLTGEEAYREAVDSYVAWIKSSATVPGVEEVLMPGEIEAQKREVRVRDGVAVPDETWRRLLELSAELGVSLDSV